MTAGFHAKSWLAWVAATLAMLSSVDDPITTLTAIAALVLVGTALIPAGAGGPAVLAFKLGVLFLAIRVVLFGLTGHTGSTVLFTLPRARVPALLGGFDIGGPILAEVVAQQFVDGMKIVALLLCFGVFLSVVESYRILRLLPRFLFEAGLVVTIAIAFVPSMVSRAREVRDAQRLRGHRFRGARALRPLVVPVLADALERSLTLAASMESRGYGRARTAAAGVEARARATLLAGLLVGSTGGGVLLFGSALAGAPLAVAGATLLAKGFMALSGVVDRTRFRPERLDAWDRVLIASSTVLFFASIGARTLEGARWYATPLGAPSFDLRLIALAAAIAAPVAIAGSRARALREASAVAIPEAA